MIVLDTLGRRWYAFAFVAVFFWAALPERGWRGAARFAALAAGVSLGAELASTRTGFPFGRYDYVATTRGQELYVSNVPLFVPLSFGTVVWAGRSIARTVIGSRGRALLVGSGALAAALIDLVIDPMTLRGRDWFLGDLYAFRSGGYFGVPWSNFGGWVLVSALILAADDLFERPPATAATARGTVFALGMCGFFVGVAVATDHAGPALAGAALTGVLALGAAAGVGQARRRAAALAPPSAAKPPN